MNGHADILFVFELIHYCCWKLQITGELLFIIPSTHSEMLTEKIDILGPLHVEIYVERNEIIHTTVCVCHSVFYDTTTEATNVRKFKILYISSI